MEDLYIAIRKVNCELKNAHEDSIIIQICITYVVD